MVDSEGCSAVSTTGIEDGGVSMGATAEGSGAVHGGEAACTRGEPYPECGGGVTGPGGRCGATAQGAGTGNFSVEVRAAAGGRRRGCTRGRGAAERAPSASSLSLWKSGGSCGGGGFGECATAAAVDGAARAAGEAWPEGICGGAFERGPSVEGGGRSGRLNHSSTALGDARRASAAGGVSTAGVGVPGIGGDRRRASAAGGALKGAFGVCGM